MFRVLVVGDEGITLKSVKNIILLNFGSECEIMYVKTGRVVIEQAGALRPDIAFVDIQMPGLNGVQAIREVRKLNSSMVFIIATAYDKFSYAQEAVNLRVTEFITKSVNRKKILEISIRAMRQVREARQKLSDGLKIREKLEPMVPMIESGFVYNLLQDDTDTYRSNHLDMLDIRKQYGLMVMLEFGDSMVDGLMANVVGANVRADKHYNQLRELVKDYFDCIVSPTIGNGITLLVFFNSERAHYEERAEIITRARNMVHKLESTIDIRFRGGIGTVKPARDIRDPYEEALRALRESNSRMVYIMDIFTIANYDGKYPLELEVQYLQRGAEADREEAASCASEFFDWMVAHAGNVRVSIEVKALGLVVHLEQKARGMGCAQYGFCYRENYLSEIRGAGDMNALRHWFIGKTREICENISTFRERENKNVTSRVKGCINENSVKDIPLDDASRLMDINPYYFSRLFKQEVGENFTEYLTRARVGHARQFLGDPRYSIREVCVMCGHNDPNCFSYIFKKCEGKTSNKYRER